MKKSLIFLSFTILFAYCKTKKNLAAPEKEVKKEESVAMPKSELSIAQKRWAGTTAADLTKGKEIYTTKCTKCHAAKKIETRSEKNWLHEIDDMSPRAHLTTEEKDKLTRYILSYREAHTTTD